MKLTYYKNLDGIRAIAALMVMVFHFFQGIDPNTKTLSILSKLSVFGQTGVTLFFVLSGFLITRILLATKKTPGFFKNFYLRRTLRIFPLYYLFLVLSYYILPYIFGHQTPNISQQLYYFTYLQNFATTFQWDAVGPGHFWSLAVEEHFYLFWPFIVYFFSKKNLTKTIFGIVIGAMVLRAWMVNQGYPVFYFTFTRFDALAIGALLAVMEKRQVLTVDNANKFLWLTAGLFIPTVIMWTAFTGSGNNYIQIYKFLFLSSIYFSLIGFLICIRKDHPINKGLRLQFLTYTGKISYGLYVYHPLAYTICKKYIGFESIILNFIVGIVLSYAIATASFYLFESSFLKLKKYFEYRKKVQPTEIAYTK